MPTITGREPSSVTLNYYRGNAFTETFTISGAGVGAPTFALAKISRIGDPDKEALILFSAGNGLTISGQDIILNKLIQEMILPPGKYEFNLEATIDGASMSLTKDSFFVIADTIENILPPTTLLTATAVSGTEMDVVWNIVSGANNYKLWRANTAAGPWSLRYDGPNASFEESGLTPLTQYFWRHEASGPGYEGGGYAYANATTMAAASGPGYFVPPGGTDGMVLTKTGPGDSDYEWQLPAVIPDPDGSETIIEPGTNVTVTGDGTVSNPYVISSTGGGGGGGGSAYTGDLLP